MIPTTDDDDDAGPFLNYFRSSIEGLFYLCKV